MRLATNLVKAVNHIAKGWKTSQMKTLTSALLLSSRNVCFYLTNQQPEYKRLVGRSGRAAGRWYRLKPITAARSLNFACYSKTSALWQCSVAFFPVDSTALQHVQPGLFKVWPLWRLGHFEEPKPFIQSAEIVTKRGFNVFWRRLCNEVLLYFEKPFRSHQNTLKNTAYSFVGAW